MSRRMALDPAPSVCGDAQHSCRKTGLLVSVRSAAEAASALAGGAHVIDVKEPDRGALGAADPLAWHAVLEVVAGRAPVSAALGELVVEDVASTAVPLLAEQTEGLAFAKIGLAGAGRFPHWLSRWKESIAALPCSVAAVAVAYADWEDSQSPPPEEVIDRGAELACAMLLFDTFAKTGRCLLDYLPVDVLARLTHRAQQRGLKVVLAGSLSRLHLPRLLPLAPALVAVRGAACRSGRRSAIDEELVRELAVALSTDASTIVGATVPLPLGA